MIRNSIFVTVTVLTLVLLGLMKRLAFLAPSQKLALFSHCGGSMAIFISALGLNLFAAILARQPETPVEGYRQKALPF